VRIIIAAISILLGALALVVGIGQRTFWAPPEIATATVQTQLEDAPVTVVGPAIATDQNRPVDVTIEADGEFTAALGRSADVDAWVGKAAHNTISGIDSETMALTAQHVDGEAKVPNPKGSDLWVASESADSHLVHRWTEPADGDWSLLLAADGTKAAPTQITVSWENDASAPFSIPLIIVGALLVVFGIASLLVAGRKPRDPQPSASTGAGTGPGIPAGGPGPGSTALKRTAAVLAAAALVLVPAVPASATPAGSPSGSASAADPADTEGNAYPVVQQDQLNRILESVADTVAAGDKAKDAKKLTSRVGGRALALRKVNYSQRSDDVKVPAPDPVVAAPLRSAAVTTSTDWPRTLMVVTGEQESKRNPQVLVLKQEDPRANYHLVNAVSMLSGSEFPGIAVGDTSIRTLGAKDDSVSVAPLTAARDLAGYLGNPKSKKKDEFAKSPFITSTHDEQAALVKANKDAKIRYKRELDEKSLHVLSTPNGGALVSAYLTSTMSATPKEEGGTVKLDDASAKLAGGSSSRKGVDIKYAEPVVFYIPADGSKDKVRLIAAESMLLSAKLK